MQKSHSEFHVAFTCLPCGMACNSHSALNLHKRRCKKRNRNAVSSHQTISLPANLSSRLDDIGDVGKDCEDVNSNEGCDESEDEDLRYVVFAESLQKFAHEFINKASKDIEVLQNITMFSHTQRCGLSDSQGTRYMSDLQKMFRRQGMKFPSTRKDWKYVRAKFEKPFMNLFEMKKCDYKIPRLFMPEGDYFIIKSHHFSNVFYHFNEYSRCFIHHTGAARPTVFGGHHLNGMQMLQTILMKFSMKDLYITPQVSFDPAGGGRIFGHPCAGRAYEELFEYNRTSFGEDVIPLIVMIGFDDLSVNKTGSRGAKPIYVQLANLKEEFYWTKHSMECFGMAPQLKVRRVSYF